MCSAVRNLDSDLAVFDLKTMERVIHEEAVGLNYMAVLMGCSAHRAAVIGDGCLCHHNLLVTERTHEIGVRCVGSEAWRRVVLGDEARQSRR